MKTANLTPHISCSPGDFAKTVLMPGDPLRAKHIAETYLTDRELVNNVRGVQGYTGYFEGKRVSEAQLSTGASVRNSDREGPCTAAHRRPPS